MLTLIMADETINQARPQNRTPHARFNLKTTPFHYAACFVLGYVAGNVELDAGQ